MEKLIVHITPNLGNKNYYYLRDYVKSKAFGTCQLYYILQAFTNKK